MIIVKFILLIIIFSLATLIGLSISKKYQTRVKELKEMQRALHIFEEKIKFTYEPIPDVFLEIADKTSKTISSIFYEASQTLTSKAVKRSDKLHHCLGAAYRLYSYNTHITFRTKTQALCYSNNRV